MAQATSPQQQMTTEYGCRIRLEPFELHRESDLFSARRGFVVSGEVNNLQNFPYGTEEAVFYKITRDGTSIDNADVFILWQRVCSENMKYEGAMFNALGLKEGDRFASISNFTPNGKMSDEERVNYERQGVGKKVLDLVIKDAKENGCVAMTTGIVLDPMKNFLRKDGRWIPCLERGDDYWGYSWNE